jgi:hypothetical protein
MAGEAAAFRTLDAELGRIAVTAEDAFITAARAERGFKIVARRGRAFELMGKVSVDQLATNPDEATRSQPQTRDW